MFGFEPPSLRGKIFATAIAVLVLYVLVSSLVFIREDPKESKKETINIKSTPTDTRMDSFGLSTFEYDSCEYIMYCTPGGRSIAHKGNCKYCAVRTKNSP
jgi:hypothetical protein